MPKLHLAPYAERVLADSIKAYTKTSTGIVFSDAANEQSQRRKKSAVEPNTSEVKTMVKPGDKVLLGECVFSENSKFQERIPDLKRM